MSDKSSNWQDAVSDYGTSLGTYVYDSSRTRQLSAYLNSNTK